MCRRRSRHPQPRVIRVGAIVCAWCSSLAAQVPPGQAPAEQATQPATQPVVQPEQPSEPISDLSADMIQDRIKQVKAATDLTETTKTEVLGLYNQALEQISVAGNWTSKIESYRKGREEAPAALEEVRKDLAAASSQPSTAPAADISPDAPLEELSQKLTESEANLKARQDDSKKLEDEAKQRSDRRVAIPELLAEANRRIERLTHELSATPGPGVSPQAAQAKRAFLAAQKRAVEQEIKAYDEELRFYNARSDVLAARRDEIKLLVAEAQARTTALQALVAQRRQADVERQKQQVEQELARAPAAVRELAERNAQLAEERAALNKKLSDLKQNARQVAEASDEVAKDFKFVQDNVGTEGMSEFIGPVMRQHRTELEGLRNHELRLRSIRQQLAQARLRHSEIEDDRVDLADLDARVREVLDALADSDVSYNLARVEPRVQESLKSRRDLLDGLKKDYETYTNDLIQISTATSSLLAKVHEFGQFIERHVLWIPSTGPLYRVSAPEDWLALSPAWPMLGRSMVKEAASHPVTYGIVVLVVAVMFAARIKIRSALREISRKVVRAPTDSYLLTLQAFVYTLILALPWPILLVFLAWRAPLSVDSTEAAAYGLAEAVEAALYATALLILTLGLVRRVCRSQGLAETHFRWDSTSLLLLRRNIRWLAIVGVPVVAIVSFTEQYTEVVWRELTGRVAFLIGMVALAVFSHRVLRPRKGVLAYRYRRSKTGWLYDLRYVWYLTALLAPLALATMSFAGYHYTAVEFAQRLSQTAWLILLLLLAHALLVRWLFVAQRRLALQHAKAKQPERGPDVPASGTSPSSSTSPFDEPALNLVAIGEQTRKLLRSLIVFGLAIGMWFLWIDMLPSLGFMKDVRLWSYTVAPVTAAGEGGAVAPATQQIAYVTLAHVVLTVLITVVTIILAKNIPGLLEIALLNKLPLDRGGRFAITSIARYTIMVVGVIAAFGAIGIGWSKVQWLVAAMTVGLGFGLQEIFANFVSGLILLFERPIRVGDTVTVGGINGDVTRIRIRATTITDWDRKELVIPNKEFVTGQVINWTLSDTTLRVIVPVGIAYGSNVALAEELLYTVARENEHVLAEPKPKALFMGFGDSSLNFELRVFVPGIDYFLETRHKLNKAIDAAFRKAGVVIAFPQRDIHVRSIDQPLRHARSASEDVTLH
jgi:potassium efflux system protein